MFAPPVLRHFRSAAFALLLLSGVCEALPISFRDAPARTHKRWQRIHQFLGQEPASAWALFDQKPNSDCEFPAQSYLKAQAEGKVFTHSKCTELNDWLARLPIEKVSVVFSAAYANNPASILGHTILRLQLGERAGRKAAGADALRDYVVGFAADTDPNDSKAMYILKGVYGGYDGMFSLEPYYMKIGLYNNSESRDLWEYPVVLSAEELQFFHYYLWEMIHWGRVPYYFFSKNCSYQLLAMLEVVKPAADFINGLHWPVLPLETIRSLQTGNSLDGNTEYRSSVLHRLDERWNRMTATQRKAFQTARLDADLAKNQKDPLVLDALIDYWTQLNYEKELQLTSDESSRMESAFTARAITTEKAVTITDAEVQVGLKLNSPLAAHRPGLASVGVLTDSEGQTYSSLSVRLGVHSFWQSEVGLESVANIELLKVSAILNQQGRAQEWSLGFADVSSVADFSSLHRNISWRFTAAIASASEGEFQNKGLLSFEGGAGLGQILGAWTFYAMPSVRVDTNIKEGFAGIGAAAGLKWIFSSKTRVTAEGKIYTYGSHQVQDTELRMVHDFASRWSASLLSQNRWSGLQLSRDF